MTAIVLTRVDAEKNMARFYKLDVQPTLFGEWSLVREWGRIGRGGTVREAAYRSIEEAHIVRDSHLGRKLKRGYVGSPN